MANLLTAWRGSFRVKTATVLYLSAFFIGVAGIALMIRTVLKAVSGSTEAAFLMLAFFAAVTGLTWLIKIYWQVILDQNDLLDVFRKTAREKKSKVEPVLLRTDRPNHFFKEQGYRFRLNEYLSGTEINLIQIEMETPDHFISQTGSYYLVFRISSSFEPRLIFFNKGLNDFDSPDIQLYCPEIRQTETIDRGHMAMTYTEQPADWIDELFSNPFIVNELNVLFSIYRLKYILFDKAIMTAVKNGIVDSCAYDIEAYHLLNRLIQLIQKHHKRYNHQTH